MRAFLLNLLLSCLLLSGPSFAQTIFGARVTWYGIYTVAQARQDKEPASASGTKNFVTGITPPSTSSDIVRAVPGTRFGFGYQLAGQPANARITVRYVYRFPPPGVADAATGALKLMDETTYPDLDIDRKDLFIGRLLVGKFPTGTWTLQVWYGDRMLVEKVFQVVAP